MSEGFTKFTDYRQTDRLLVQGALANQEEIDGHCITYFIDLDGCCVGIWYVKAGYGTMNQAFGGDVLDYTDADPFYPYDIGWG